MAGSRRDSRVRVGEGDRPAGRRRGGTNGGGGGAASAGGVATAGGRRVAAHPSTSKHGSLRYSSPAEAEAARREIERGLRLQRLEQVRQQSRQHAAAMREEYRSRREESKRVAVLESKRAFDTVRHSEVLALNQQLQNKLIAVGTAHRMAVCTSVAKEQAETRLRVKRSMSAERSRVRNAAAVEKKAAELQEARKRTRVAEHRQEVWKERGEEQRAMAREEAARLAEVAEARRARAEFDSRRLQQRAESGGTVKASRGYVTQIGPRVEDFKTSRVHAALVLRHGSTPGARLMGVETATGNPKRELQRKKALKEEKRETEGQAEIRASNRGHDALMVQRDLHAASGLEKELKRLHELDRWRRQGPGAADVNLAALREREMRRDRQGKVYGDLPLHRRAQKNAGRMSAAATDEAYVGGPATLARADKPLNMKVENAQLREWPGWWPTPPPQSARTTATAAAPAGKAAVSHPSSRCPTGETIPTEGERLQLIEHARRGLLDSVLRAEDQGSGRADSSTVGIHPPPPAVAAAVAASASGDSANVDINGGSGGGGHGERTDGADQVGLLPSAVRHGQSTTPPGAVAVGRATSSATGQSAAAAAATGFVSAGPIGCGGPGVASPWLPIADGGRWGIEPIRTDGPAAVAAAATAAAAAGGSGGGAELTPVDQNLGAAMRAPTLSPPVSPPSPPGGRDEGEVSSMYGGAMAEVAGRIAPSRFGASVTPTQKPSTSTGSPRQERVGSPTRTGDDDGRTTPGRQGVQSALSGRGAGRESGGSVDHRRDNARTTEARASRLGGEVRVPRVQQEADPGWDADSEGSPPFAKAPGARIGGQPNAQLPVSVPRRERTNNVVRFSGEVALGAEASSGEEAPATGIGGLESTAVYASAATAMSVGVSQKADERPPEADCSVNPPTRTPTAMIDATAVAETTPGQAEVPGRRGVEAAAAYRATEASSAAVRGAEAKESMTEIRETGRTRASSPVSVAAADGAVPPSEDSDPWRKADDILQERKTHEVAWQGFEEANKNTVATDNAAAGGPIPAIGSTSSVGALGHPDNDTHVRLRDAAANELKKTEEKRRSASYGNAYPTAEELGRRGDDERRIDGGKTLLSWRENLGMTGPAAASLVGEVMRADGDSSVGSPVSRLRRSSGIGDVGGLSTQFGWGGQVGISDSEDSNRGGGDGGGERREEGGVSVATSSSTLPPLEEELAELLERHRRLDKEAEKLTRHAEADASQWDFETTMSWSPSRRVADSVSSSSPRRDDSDSDRRFPSAEPPAAAVTTAAPNGQQRGSKYSSVRSALDALPEELGLGERMGMRGGSVGGSTNDTPTSVSSSSVMGRYRAGGAEDGSSSGGGGDVSLRDEMAKAFSRQGPAAPGWRERWRFGGAMPGSRAALGVWDDAAALLDEEAKSTAAGNTDAPLSGKVDTAREVTEWARRIQASIESMNKLVDGFQIAGGSTSGGTGNSASRGENSTAPPRSAISSSPGGVGDAMTSGAFGVVFGGSSNSHHSPPGDGRGKEVAASSFASDVQSFASAQLGFRRGLEGLLADRSRDKRRLAPVAVPARVTTGDSLLHDASRDLDGAAAAAMAAANSKDEVGAMGDVSLSDESVGRAGGTGGGSADSPPGERRGISEATLSSTSSGGSDGGEDGQDGREGTVGVGSASVQMTSFRAADASADTLEAMGERLLGSRFSSGHANRRVEPKRLFDLSSSTDDAPPAGSSLSISISEASVTAAAAGGIPNPASTPSATTFDDDRSAGWEETKGDWQEWRDAAVVDNDERSSSRRFSASAAGGGRGSREGRAGHVEGGGGAGGGGWREGSVTSWSSNSFGPDLQAEIESLEALAASLQQRNMRFDPKPALLVQQQQELEEHRRAIRAASVTGSSLSTSAEGLAERFGLPRRGPSAGRVAVAAAAATEGSPDHNPTRIAPAPAPAASPSSLANVQDVMDSLMQHPRPAGDTRPSSARGGASEGRQTAPSESAASSMDSYENILQELHKLKATVADLAPTPNFRSPPATPPPAIPPPPTAPGGATGMVDGASETEAPGATLPGGSPAVAEEERTARVGLPSRWWRGDGSVGSSGEGLEWERQRAHRQWESTSSTQVRRSPSTSLRESAASEGADEKERMVESSREEEKGEAGEKTAGMGDRKHGWGGRDADAQKALAGMTSMSGSDYYPGDDMASNVSGAWSLPSSPAPSVGRGTDDSHSSGGGNSTDAAQSRSQPSRLTHSMLAAVRTVGLTPVAEMSPLTATPQGGPESSKFHAARGSTRVGMGVEARSWQDEDKEPASDGGVVASPSSATAARLPSDDGIEVGYDIYADRGGGSGVGVRLYDAPGTLDNDDSGDGKSDGAGDARRGRVWDVMPRRRRHGTAQKGTSMESEHSSSEAFDDDSDDSSRTGYLDRRVGERSGGDDSSRDDGKLDIRAASSPDSIAAAGGAGASVQQAARVIVRGSSDIAADEASGEPLPDDTGRSERGQSRVSEQDQGSERAFAIAPTVAAATTAAAVAPAESESNNPNLSIDADIAQEESSYSISRPPLGELSPLEAPGWGSLAEYIEGGSIRSTEESGIDWRDNSILNEQQQQTARLKGAVGTLDDVSERVGSVGGGRWREILVHEFGTHTAGSTTDDEGEHKGDVGDRVGIESNDQPSNAATATAPDDSLVLTETTDAEASREEQASPVAERERWGADTTNDKLLSARTRHDSDDDDGNKESWRGSLWRDGDRETAGREDAALNADGEQDRGGINYIGVAEQLRMSKEARIHRREFDGAAGSGGGGGSGGDGSDARSHDESKNLSLEQSGDGVDTGLGGDGVEERKYAQSWREEKSGAATGLDGDGVEERKYAQSWRHQIPGAATRLDGDGVEERKYSQSWRQDVSEAWREGMGPGGSATSTSGAAAVAAATDTAIANEIRDEFTDLIDHQVWTDENGSSSSNSARASSEMDEVTRNAISDNDDRCHSPRPYASISAYRTPTPAYDTTATSDETEHSDNGAGSNAFADISGGGGAALGLFGGGDITSINDSYAGDGEDGDSRESDDRSSVAAPPGVGSSGGGGGDAANREEVGSYGSNDDVHDDDGDGDEEVEFSEMLSGLASREGNRTLNSTSENNDGNDPLDYSWLLSEFQRRERRKEKGEGSSQSSLQSEAARSAATGELDPARVTVTAGSHGNTDSPNDASVTGGRSHSPSGAEATAAAAGERIYPASSLASWSRNSQNISMANTDADNALAGRSKSNEASGTAAGGSNGGAASLTEDSLKVSEPSEDSLSALVWSSRGGADTSMDQEPSPRASVARAWVMAGDTNTGVAHGVPPENDRSPHDSYDSQRDEDEGRTGDLASFFNSRAESFISRSREREMAVRQRRESRQQARDAAAARPAAAAAAASVEMPAPNEEEDERPRARESGTRGQDRERGTAPERSAGLSTGSGQSQGRRRVSTQEARARTARLYNNLPEVREAREKKEKANERLRQLKVIRTREKERSRFGRGSRGGSGRGGAGSSTRK